MGPTAAGNHGRGGELRELSADGMTRSAGQRIFVQSSYRYTIMMMRKRPPLGPWQEELDQRLQANEAKPSRERLIGCGNSPLLGDEWHVVAVVEADFTGKGAIFWEVGVTVAGDLGAFVAAMEGEMRSRFAVPAIETDLDDAEFDVAIVMVELDVTGSEHIDVVGIPALDLDDAPASQHLGCRSLRHAVFASSLGRRTRLHAAAVSVTIQPTRARPRWRVLRSPAAALIQPNGSSMRLRRIWLIA